jgi:hypothetical protein
MEGLPPHKQPPDESSESSEPPKKNNPEYAEGSSSASSPQDHIRRQYSLRPRMSLQALHHQNKTRKRILPKKMKHLLKKALS